ncbi:bifunctional 6-phosphofructo-2-kinase/fructose-2,6-bisphosphate 2-phosphatase [Aureobasidium subglaciale]|nr:bifunctional 6-phosphofructo-2-kinase/fructose-2,6-bisphosphate 2-phosphatase [Aureobasidium subglaciale]
MPLICEPSEILAASSTSSTLPFHIRRQSQQSDIAKSVMMSNAQEQQRRSIDENTHKDLKSSLNHSLGNAANKKGSQTPEIQPFRPPPTNRTASAVGAASTGALNDTPDGTAPNSPRLLPIRQNSGSSTPRVRPTTLDIPGLTKSKVSPDGRIAKRDVGAKLVIVMVGLPARGKSYITKKLARYLNWLQHDTRIFNVGERRRVAAGGPNTLEKTKSHAHRPSFLPTEHRPSLASLNGIVDAKTQFGSSGLAGQIQAHSDGHSSSGKQESSADRRRLTMPTIQLPPAGDNALATEDGVAESVDDGTEGVELTKVSTPEMPADMDSMDQSANFFDPSNKRAALIREQCAMDTLDELLDYILEGNGSVGILDATNSTLERRKVIMKRIRERAGTELNVLFLESRCVDENLLESNMRLKLSGPDYKDQDPVAALEDFKKRVAIYEKAYVPLGEYEEKNNMPYIQMIDVGRKVISHQIRGFLSAQANYYLLNFNLAPRMIWITRHGLSMDNVSGKIGGDSDLSSEGIQYAKTLTKFIEHARREWDMKQLHKLTHSHFPPQPGDTTPPNPHYQPNDNNELPQKSFCVWTSMLKRSIQTAQFFDDEEYDSKQMRMLDELNAGIMEGLTYSSIAEAHPAEYALRKKDKLHYRYPGPGGEGYLDIINRLRPVIVELERMEDHCLLVGHRSVARVLLAYFRGLKREEVADLDVPIGMLYCLEPKPYGVDFKAYKWDKKTEWFYEQPNFQLKRAEDDMQ